MFVRAYDFDQELGFWDIDEGASLSNMFDQSYEML
jgi:hypothetical protein